MQQIGLALSGGGFRATLYHLGVIRFLRDADLLKQVSHITSVSGGSVVGAHLALNWDRYCGSELEFDAAANEVIRFIQLDVRNRIVRRYPLAALLNGTRRGFRIGASRRLTRPGLLEAYYKNHLYGDRCLSELPEYPQLHILATNVREGSLCSFTRRGIIFQTQMPDNQQSFKLVNAGLTTIPMAVAASSAFPGFFPPLELSAEDVGADEGEFPPHSFIDGGVFDNLGIRMFRWINQSWMQKEIGHPNCDRNARGPDSVIVSDAGKKITSVARDKSSGLVQTAIRSSEILMNRVWQLEKETFENTSGFIFASSNDLVTPTEDPTAMHPEIQRQVTRIRTDLDYFNDLEIRSLIQHGYCVARKTCRTNPEFFGNNIPDDPPWDPMAGTGSFSTSVAGRASEPIAWARQLQKSSRRRIWSAMFSWRDWPTYVWIPLILLLLVGGPYRYLAAHRNAQLNEALLTATSQGKQIEIQIESAVRAAKSAATFMSELPPIQGIIDARNNTTPKGEREANNESEEIWNERLEIIFQGLLRARPACLSASFMELDESGGREIVRVERYNEKSSLVHTVPDSRLSLVTAGESLKQASHLLPGNVKVFCTELRRDGSTNKRFQGKRLIATAAVHDANNEDFFGIVVLEFDLEPVVGSLLTPVSANVDAVYITDQHGMIVLSSESSQTDKSSLVETNIVAFIPGINGFLTPENRSEMLSTDKRSFVASKIWLNSNDPDSMMGVVIHFKP